MISFSNGCALIPQPEALENLGVMAKSTNVLALLLEVGLLHLYTYSMLLKILDIFGKSRGNNACLITQCKM